MKARPINDPAPARVRVAVELMYAHLRLRLSPSRLGELFQQDTGTSSLCYLCDLRMQQAKRLLETTFLASRRSPRGLGTPAGGTLRNSFKGVTARRRLNIGAGRHRTLPTTAETRVATGERLTKRRGWKKIGCCRRGRRILASAHECNGAKNHA